MTTVTGLGSAAAFAMLPEVQQSFTPTPAFLGSVAADDLWLRASWILSILFALAAYATVAVVGRILGAGTSSLALAGTAAGMLGYAVVALQNATDLVAIPAAAVRYAEDGALPAQQARIDPGGVLQTLTIGAWLAVAAVLGRMRAAFPVWLTALGMAAAVGFLLAAISAATAALGEPNVAVVLLVAGVVIPVWFAGLAFMLLRSRVPAPTESMRASPR